VSTPERPASPASVRARLLNRARARGEEFEYVLTRYANERLLYRLSKSSFREQFVLKGAMLFELWSDAPHRATRDIDLLGVGEATIPHLVEVFKAICTTEVEPDGITFVADSVEGSTIREDQEYEGVRLRLSAELASARIGVQIDIGFGDALTPGARVETYPVMLDQPAPVLKVYPRESVVAEKLEAMISLGIANSRMKDFYDLRLLADRFAFDGSSLRDAIGATFERRHTPVPGAPPTAFTETFFGDATKIAQWRAFQNKFGAGGDDTALRDVVVSLIEFLMPPMKAAATRVPFLQHWSPRGGWSALPLSTRKMGSPEHHREE